MGESVRGRLVSRTSSETGWREFLGGISAYELDFSRDGKWVAYACYPDHTIYKADMNGSNAVRLTPPGWEAHQPHWSPDGTRIAFMAQKPGGKWRVFVVAIGKGDIQELVHVRR
jgi:Tol biopolymer transport system component